VGAVGSAEMNSNLQAIDLGAIFGGDVTGSIDVKDIFAAAQGIDSEYFFDVAATGAGGIVSDDAPQEKGRTVCIFCDDTEDADGNIIDRVCLKCWEKKGSAAGAGTAAPGASLAPLVILP
jgi:hypothetical protein